MRIDPNDWRPVGVESLEPAAENAVKSRENLLVVAGPGAGKTELLAQRACYLLQTGLCPAPKRILAISFKRDAAKNLQERVKKRCGDDAGRFDSFTLDAFAKGLVDRFGEALPESWRPKLGYEVLVTGMRTSDIRDWLVSAGVERHKVERHEDQTIRREFDHICHGIRLPYEGEDVKPLQKELGIRWWQQQLTLPVAIPSLSFPMLSRLAAFLLSKNPKLLGALHSTYAYVFLDEFQDTTAAQYDLFRAAFSGSPAVITAVGDGKQRIMLWAGAKVDVFETYETEFSARKLTLVSNYRSAPELVAIQHVIAQALESGTVPAIAAGNATGGICSVLEYSTSDDEAKSLAEFIAKKIDEEGLAPRDFCVLVRQIADQMVGPLQAALAKKGVKLRDETRLQDLLAEPVIELVMAVLKLATRPRDPEAWEKLREAVGFLYGYDPEEDGQLLEKTAKEIVGSARENLAQGKTIEKMPLEIADVIGKCQIRASYRQYSSGSFLDDVINSFSEYLKVVGQNVPDFRVVVDEIAGNDVVPAMTIHKSKGLEFKTVIFMGLEDSQWWSFANQPDEEKRNFFVAFSRAIEQVFFTFTDMRDGRRGPQRQGKAGIGDLYNLLKRAGVQVVNLRPKEG